MMLFMFQMGTTVVLTAKNNANILSETSGLFKSEVDMLGETEHLNRGYGGALHLTGKSVVYLTN